MEPILSWPEKTSYMSEWNIQNDEFPCSPTCDEVLYSSCDDTVSDDITIILPQATSVIEKCGYRTGKCFNIRSLKRNGKYHKLCEVHREKANLNQKKLDRKKRMKRFLPYETPILESLSLPINLDDHAPICFGFDEVVFFCDLMSKKKNSNDNTNSDLRTNEIFHFVQDLLV